MTAERPDGAENARRGRVGGYASAAALTPEQRRERARKAVQARWDRENARRAAEGKAPTKKTAPALDDESLDYYLAQVDALFPDREWKFASDRKRQAIALARADAARAAAEAFRRAQMDRGDV
ncbi:hypothetical protein [Microbacterium sp. PAMC21962]|uniref:hypothetical protein n=1 Tax=Microbacterium sp. PAMC21962 TaxID=2861280 RepID=UPI001C62A599|nr:hypothetical protein [Microbacterium sp. PAMC21962]QYF98279.1 hypothetical protein KY498_03265 [Microbacterium sp. PAMC21962]